MIYHELVVDFAKRTRENLETLRKLQKERPDIKVYEVTQLINSLLGLLVFPKERFINHIPEIPLDELSRQGWPIPKVTGDYPQAAHLRALVRYLRNAIAHCNVEFLSDEKNEIKGLLVWNEHKARKTWQAELTLQDINSITERFLKLITDDKV